LKKQPKIKILKIYTTKKLEFIYIHIKNMSSEILIRDSILMMLSHSINLSSGGKYTDTFCTRTCTSLYNSYVRFWPDDTEFDATKFFNNEKNCLVKLGKKVRGRKPQIISKINILRRGYDVMFKNCIDHVVNEYKKQQTGDTNTMKNNTPEPEKVEIVNKTQRPANKKQQAGKKTQRPSNKKQQVRSAPTLRRSHRIRGSIKPVVEPVKEVVNKKKTDKKKVANKKPKDPVVNNKKTDNKVVNKKSEDPVVNNKKTDKKKVVNKKPEDPVVNNKKPAKKNKKKAVDKKLSPVVVNKDKYPDVCVSTELLNMKSNKPEHFISCSSYPRKKFETYINIASSEFVGHMSKHRVQMLIKRVSQYLASICSTTFHNLEFCIRHKHFNLAFFYINPIANIKSFIRANRSKSDEVISLFTFLSALFRGNGLLNLSKLYDPDFLIRFYNDNDYCFMNEQNIYSRIDYIFTKTLVMSKNVEDLLNLDDRISMAIIPKESISETSIAYDVDHYYIDNDKLSQMYVKDNELTLRTGKYYDYFWSHYKIGLFGSSFQEYYNSYKIGPNGKVVRRNKYIQISKVVYTFLQKVKVENDDDYNKQLLKKILQLTAQHIKIVCDTLWKNKAHDCTKSEFYNRIKNLKLDYKKLTKRELKY